MTEPEHLIDARAALTKVVAEVIEAEEKRVEESHRVLARRIADSRCTRRSAGARGRGMDLDGEGQDVTS